MTRMLCGLRVGAVDIHLRFCPAVAARSMVESMLAGLIRRGYRTARHDLELHPSQNVLESAGFAFNPQLARYFVLTISEPAHMSATARLMLYSILCLDPRGPRCLRGMVLCTFKLELPD
ncbi:unnamed protein product [Symbiodinium natans]|uniref:Uncharacterized protein n=1 Tax=Symbiodinium natans TaxID=878477 RepID=A0A812SWN3_9DINO|nr:unnamed protein product [Symbiodinium natans]